MATWQRPPLFIQHHRLQIVFLLCFVLAAFSAASCHLFQKIGQNPPPIKHIAQKIVESCEANDVCFLVRKERERGIIGGGSAANRLISKPTPDAGTALCLNKSLWYLCSCVVLCCIVVRLSIHRINYQYDLVAVFYW